MIIDDLIYEWKRNKQINANFHIKTLYYVYVIVFYQ